MFIKLFLIATLIPMIVSDFRYRSVSVVWLGIFTATACFIRFYKCEIYTTCINTGINIFIISWMVAGTLGYFSIKYRASKRKFLDCIGLGDILFLFSTTLLFAPPVFPLFLIISLIFSLVWYYCTNILLRCNQGGDHKTIPLVATTGLCYLFYILLNLTGHGA